MNRAPRQGLWRIRSLARSAGSVNLDGRTPMLEPQVMSHPVALRPVFVVVAVIVSVGVGCLAFSPASDAAPPRCRSVIIPGYMDITHVRATHVRCRIARRVARRAGAYGSPPA